MNKNRYKMRAAVWLYPGTAHSSAKASAAQGAWHFLTLPKKQSAEIKQRFGTQVRGSILRQGFGMARGFGSIPVLVTINKTSWKTSIFPDRKSGAYLLPLKSDVRKKEKIAQGDTVTFSIEIRV